MRTNTFCPINNQKINERVARINGILSAVILGVFLVTLNVIPVIFLAIDFYLRSSKYAKYSPVRYASCHLAKWLQLKKVEINAGPKQFAAKIGFIFTIAVSIAFLFQASILAFSLSVILILFALLEGVFGLCVACEIYPFVYRFLYKEKPFAKI